MHPWWGFIWGWTPRQQTCHPSCQRISQHLPVPAPALPFPSRQGWQSCRGTLGWVPGCPYPVRDTPGPCFENVAQGNAHNHLPRTNEKIIPAGKELQTPLEASKSSWGSWCVVKHKSSYCRVWQGCPDTGTRDWHHLRAFLGSVWWLHPAKPQAASPTQSLTSRTREGIRKVKENHGLG